MGLCIRILSVAAVFFASVSVRPNRGLAALAELALPEARLQCQCTGAWWAEITDASELPTCVDPDSIEVDIFVREHGQCAGEFCDESDCDFDFYVDACAYNEETCNWKKRFCSGWNSTGLDGCTNEPSGVTQQCRAHAGSIQIVCDRLIGRGLVADGVTVAMAWMVCQDC